MVGRVPGDPTLMKTHRHLVDQALTLVDVPANRIAFIGDSLTDINVGRLTGLRTIGFAKRPGRDGDRAGSRLGRCCGGTLRARRPVNRECSICVLVTAVGVTRGSAVERMTRIELACSAWEADVLPLNYIRRRHRSTRGAV